MAKIFAKYNFTGVSSPYIICTVVEHSAPLAEIDRAVLTSASYDGSSTFESLNAVMHKLTFFESTNGIALGSQLISLSIDATIYNDPGVEFITFLVGGGRGTPYFDPLDGDSTYTNPNLDGFDYIVFIEGFGAVDPSYYNQIVGGGFTFNNGKLFVAGERGVITKYLTVSVPSDTVLARQYQDISEITGNITFGSTYYNTLLRTAVSGTTATVTFPAHITVPNFTRLKLSTHGGSQNYLILQFNGAETTKFYNANVNRLYLAKGEEIELSWKDGVCYIVDYRGNYLMRGKAIQSYENTSGRPFLYAHTDTGVLNKADYPGLYEFILNLPAGVACTSYTDWALSSTIDSKTKYANKSRYAIDTISETFRVPDLSNLYSRFMKASGATDTDRVSDVPGGYQVDKVGSHLHDYKRIRTDAIGTQYESNHMNGGSGRGLWTGDTVQTELTGETTGTRVENYGQIPLIYL